MTLAERSGKVLTELLAAMRLEAQVSVSDEPERVTLEVRGPETALVIGKKGQTLDALQYLVNRMVQRSLDEGEESKPVSVDAEGYRTRRAETLVDLAHRLAEEVRRTGQPVAFDPMSPGERRVIHLALSNEPDLTTRSEGEGIYRHLVILPTDVALPHESE